MASPDVARPVRHVRCHWLGKAVALAALVLAVSGCYRTRMGVRSPDGSQSVEVREACSPPDCSVRVDLVSGFRRSRIAQRSDCLLRFAHVAWTPDSRTVGVYVHSLWCPAVEEAYDTKTQERVSFDRVREAMRRSIARKYGLSGAELTRHGGDPLVWAQGGVEEAEADSARAFRESHR